MMILVNTARYIDPDILGLNDAQWTKIFLHGEENLDE